MSPRLRNSMPPSNGTSRFNAAVELFWRHRGQEDRRIDSRIGQQPVPVPTRTRCSRTAIRRPRAPRQSGGSHRCYGQRWRWQSGAAERGRCRYRVGGKRTQSSGIDGCHEARLAHPKTRLEAITSRPKLLAAVGRMTQHSRVTKLVLAVTHEPAAEIKTLIANVRAGLNHIRAVAPQLYKAQRWPTMLRYIVGQMLAC